MGGLDYGLTDRSGSFNPDVAYLLQTSDGCNIFVRERGHAPNVFLLFETSSDKYAWLNAVVAYGKAARAATGIAVDVFKVSSPLSPLGFLCNSSVYCGHFDEEEAHSFTV